MDRFDQYLADELYLDEAWFDRNYDAIHESLIEDGYTIEEATELAMEELLDVWRAQTC